MAALLLLSAAVFTQAQAPSDAKPAGGGSLGATNFRTAGAAAKTVPGQGMMDRLQDDIFGTHKPMNISPPGVPDLTPHRQLQLAPPPDERAREKMDAQKNWVFSGINELNSAPTPEVLLGMPERGPDGLEKPRLSAMEKYYNGLDGDKSSISNKMPDLATMLWTVKQLSGTNSLSPLIIAFPNGDPALMKSLMMLPQLNPAAGNTAAPDNAASPSDSMAAAAAAAAADRDSKQRLDKFRQILGVSPDAPAGAQTSFTGGGTFTPSQPVTAPVFNPGYAPVSATFTPSSLNPVMTGFTPAAAGGYHPYNNGFAAPVMSAGAASYGNSQTPVMQPSRETQPFPLDPFAANFPKRKF